MYIYRHFSLFGIIKAFLFYIVPIFLLYNVHMYGNTSYTRDFDLQPDVSLELARP